MVAGGYEATGITFNEINAVASGVAQTLIVSFLCYTHSIHAIFANIEVLNSCLVLYGQIRSPPLLLYSSQNNFLYTSFELS